VNLLKFAGVAPLLFVFWWLGGMAFCRQANSQIVVRTTSRHQLQACSCTRRDDVYGTMTCLELPGRREGMEAPVYVRTTTRSRSHRQ
jgi:hypothetical protein